MKPVYRILLTISTILLFVNPLRSEGWRELRPGNNLSGRLEGHKYSWFSNVPSVTDITRMHVVTKNAGEKIYYGFNWDPTSSNIFFIVRLYDQARNVLKIDSIHQYDQGFILNYNQAVAGPLVLNPAGYFALEYAPGAAGDYMLDIQYSDPNLEGLYFDFDATVIDTTPVPVSEMRGRVYCGKWHIRTDLNPNGLPCLFYNLSSDSIITEVDLRGFNGLNLEFVLNHNGIYPPPTSWSISRKSGIITNRVFYPEYKIFVNDPDITVFPPGIMGQIIPGSFQVNASCNGSADISYAVNKTGDVEIDLEVDPAPGIQPVDIVILSQGASGNNLYHWDGLDGLGQPVTNGTLIKATVIYMNGLTNLPYFFGNSNPNGLHIRLQHPTGPVPLLYWDDTAFDPGLYNLGGCLSPPSPAAGCHITYGAPYAWNSTVNTWWYVSVNKEINNFAFKRNVSDTTAQTVCAGTPVIFHGQNITTSGFHTVNFPSVLTGCDSSYTLNLTYNPSPLVQLGNDTLICTGQNLLLDAGTCQCTYQWNSPPGGPVVGTSQTLTVGSPGTFSATVTGTNGCSGGDTIVVGAGQPLPIGVTITASENPVCTGTTVTYTATTVNPGNTPAFQWTVNGSNMGTNDSVFTFVPANGDVVLCQLTSSITSCISTNPVSSNSISMTVNPLNPVSVSIVPSDNPVCEGVPVTFTATPIPANGNLTYQWFVNAIPAGTNSQTLTITPANNDAVYCRFSTDLTCTTGSPAQSATVTMTVNPNLPVSVTISGTPNPVCSGHPLNFTATPFNGGSNPVYHWFVNGIDRGAGTSAFSYSPTGNDVVSCSLQAVGVPCTSNNPASSNLVNVSILSSPVVSLVRCNDSVTTTNAKPFSLKGAIPRGGTFTGPGVNSTTGIFTPSLAGAGLKTITYAYTNVAGCQDSKNIVIDVRVQAPFTCGNSFTDIRDGKDYTTIKIGNQCWFAEDLRFGSSILQTQHQRDNCLPEKYDQIVPPPFGGGQEGAVYQWDEIMDYSDVGGQQGLCPPGWHVPAEAEWQTLFSNYTNNAFAGAALKFSGFSGFLAQLNGIDYQNTGWSFPGYATYYWSSTSNGPYKAWAHAMNTPDPSVAVYSSSRQNAFAVRCLKD